MRLNQSLWRIAIAAAAMLPHTVGAQDAVVTPAQAVGAAGIITVTPNDGIQSVNPSLMAEVDGLNIAASYTLPYNITDIQQVMGKVVYATSLVNIAAQVSTIGSDESRYTEIGGGLSRNFGVWGMGLEYHAIIHKLPYNQKYTTGFSRIGVHMMPTSAWLISVALHNVEHSGFDYEYGSKDIEPMAALGIRWTASNYFRFMCEAQKYWDSDVVGKVAVVVTPIDRLTATVGFASLGSSISCGVGYSIGVFEMNVGISHHDKLGVTSAASVGINGLWGRSTQ